MYVKPSTYELMVTYSEWSSSYTQFQMDKYNYPSNKFPDPVLCAILSTVHHILLHSNCINDNIKIKA